jgi:general secretion pathway protein I
VIEHTCRPREPGFSLLEVLVAFAVLSISLTTILSVYSTALRSTASAARYATAMQFAESKISEITASNTMADVVDGGAFAERYEWIAVISPLEWKNPDNPVEHPLTPYRIGVEVYWSEAGRSRSVALSTVKLARQQ